MKTTKKLFIICILNLLPLSTLFAIDYYWTGANSNLFSNAGNWRTDTQNPATDYPKQNDTVFFDVATPQMTVQITNVMNVHSIICTQPGYTLALYSSLNVYGNLLLNGNMRIISNTVTMLNDENASPAMLAMGDGVVHSCNLTVNKPNSGVNATTDIDINGSYPNVLHLQEGDFTINGKNITVGLVRFYEPSIARTITLSSCILTTNNGRPDNAWGNDIRSNNNVYNTGTCDWINVNTSTSISASIAFNSLTLSNAARCIVGVSSGHTLTVNQLNVSTPYWNETGSGTYTIGTLKFNRTGNVVTTNNTVFQTDAIDETALSCNSRASIVNATITASMPLATSFISYTGCTATNIETDRSNDGGANSGITWTPASGKDFYWIGGTGDWNDPEKWSLNASGSPAVGAGGCVPSAADTVYFNSSAATGSVNLPASAACAKIVWQSSGNDRAGALNTNANSSLFILGDADFSGVDSVSVPLYFSNADSPANDFILKSGNDSTYRQPIYFRHTGTYTLDGNLRSTQDVIHYSGKIVAGGDTIECRTFQSAASLPATAVREFDLSNSVLISRYTGASVNLSLSNGAVFNFTNSEIILYPSTESGYTSLYALYGTFNFHKLTFNGYGGNMVSTGYLYFSNASNSFHALTFNAVDGNFTNAYSFSADTLTLSPQRTYTFANNHTITVNDSLNPRTGSCDQIFLTGGTADTHKSTIKNMTGKEMAIPGGVLTRIYYAKGTDNTNLQVPNGTDNGGNDPANIDFTPRAPQVFYWVGGMGNWFDPAHWAIGNPADTYPVSTNPNGCVPAGTDTVYFNTHSFGNVLQGDTVYMDNAVRFASMIWTADAGAKQPVLYVHDMTVSGYIQLANGMTVNGNKSRPTVSFTGVSNDPDAQKFDTDGVDLSTFLWGTPVFSTGRYDLYGKFYFYLFNFTVNGSLYTHGSSITVPTGNGNVIRITQSPGKTVDLSGTTLRTTEATTINITINECGNFNGTGTKIITTYGTSEIINNDNSSCIANIGTYEYNQQQGYSSGALACNGTSPVHFDKVTINSTSFTLSGLLSVDTLELKTFGGTLNIRLGGNVAVNSEIIIAGSPCDYFNIQSATPGTQADLHIGRCDMVSDFINVKDIHAILPAGCDPADAWAVYGSDQGNNSGPIDFRQAPTTGINNRPKLISACKPYTLALRGSSLSFKTVVWYRNGVTIPSAANQSSIAVSDSALYSANIIYNSSGGNGCNATMSQTVAFHTDFTWTGQSITDPTDWNDPNNWDMVSVPDACSYVTIPEGASFYPIIVEEDLEALPSPIPAAVCDTVDIRFGGEVKNTHFLTYTGAKMHLTLNSNQWYLFSPPLCNFYPGDIYVNYPNPVRDGYFVETMLFNANNPETGEYNSYNWSGRFNNPDVSMEAGEGMAVWIDKHDTGYGDQFPTYFNFPKPDTFYYFYTYGGDPYYRTPDLDRTLSGRFIYEAALDKNTGDVTLAASPCDATEQPILVGNPFPTHLDMDEFLNDNAGIYDGYKLASGVSTQNGKMNEMISYKKINGTWYTNNPGDVDFTTETSLIAPMQSFIVISKVAAPTIKANVSTHTALAPAPGSTLRSAILGRQNSALGITASRGDDRSKALLLQLNSATSTYSPEEDSYKLFSESTLSSLAVYTRSSDGYALDINSVQDLSQPVPLCLRTLEQGAVTLTFSNAENFAVNSPLYLHDLKLNRSINLRQQLEYSFTKDDDETLYLEDRFLLSATAAATGIEQPESSTQPVIQQAPDGAIFILSGNDTPLRSIQITDAQGRILAMEANAQSPYIYKVAASGIYIVRISGESGTTVKKIIIK